MPSPNWKPPVLAPYLRPHEEAPEVQAAFSDPVDHEDSPTVKSKVGVDDLDREVYYDPDYAADKLPNAHLAITGESGSGKTQGMKNIMADLNAAGIPALVLDFKDDYSDPLYAEKENFRVIDPTKQPLPINPLAPPADSNGYVNPTFHGYQLGEIISRIYRLGDIQGYKLREAIKGVYGDAGIDMASHRPDQNVEWPSFQNVKDKLAGDKDNTELIGHMSPIFDFGLFSGTDTNLGGLGGFATSNTVIRLAQLPGNEVKNNVAEFFLMALYNHLIREAQTSHLHQILVLDEAWRLVQSPFLEPLMRESRAFGLGIFVATQFPTDLPQTVSGNAATKLFFSQSSPSQINEIARIITGKPYGTPEADRVQGDIRSLKPLHCVLENKQYEPYVVVAADPYFARTEEPTMQELPQPTAGRNFNQSKGENYKTRYAQSMGDPEYICPRCQSPVANPGETCASCMNLVNTFDDTLTSDSDQASIQQRIDNARGGDKVAAIEFPECRNCGKMSGFKPYGFARGFLECNNCGHLDTTENVGDDYNNMLLHHDMDLSSLPETSHPLGDANAKKQAELQNFPPGEGEDDGNPFMPFSMSEWQMVKGPKLKPRGGAVDDDTRFCEGCEKQINEDDWDETCPGGDSYSGGSRHWQDPTPVGGTHRGIEGCTHLHYFPNVKPSNCSYCSGTE